MFEFMHKYRIWILGLLFVGLIGWGAWAAIEQIFVRGPENRILGSFTVPGTGEKREVALLEFANVRHRLLEMEQLYGRFGGRENVMANMLSLGDKSPDTLTWSFLALSEAAKAANIPVSEKEIQSFVGGSDEKPVKMSDERRAFTADFFRVFKFRNLYSRDPAGPLYKDLYETRYKLDHEELKGLVALFERKPLTEFNLNLEDPADMNKLVEFFDKPENAGVKAQQRIQEQVDLEIVYVRVQDKSKKDFATEFETKWAAHCAEFAVTDEECLARWNNHQDAYRQSVIKLELDEIKKAQEEENKKAAEEKREPKNLSAGDQPSEYDRVKEHIQREIKISKLLTKVIDEVKAGPTLLSEAAQKYDLPISKLNNADRTKVQTQPEIGNPRAMQMIWTLGVGKFPPAGTFQRGQIVEYESTNAEKYLPRIFDEPCNYFGLFRLVDHRPARDPELREIKNSVLEAWQKKQADEELKERAKAVRDAVDAKLLEIPEVKTKKEELDKERQAAIDKEIADQKLSREKEEDKPKIAAIEATQDRTRDEKLNEAKKSHELATFKVVAAEKEISIESFDWVRKSSGAAMTYRDDLSREEKINRYLRSNTLLYQLGALEAGRVGQPLFVEPTAGLTGILALEEKRAPSAEDMLQNLERVDSMARSQAERPAPDEWSYKSFKNAGWFQLDAPETEEDLADIDASEKMRARRREEDARKKAERKFEEELKALEKKRNEEPPPPPAPPTPQK